MALKTLGQWPDDPAQFAVELVLVPGVYPCPCCGHLTFGRPPGSYDVCPVCFWEDDAAQLRWPTYEEAPNRQSLITAQRAYAEDGTTEPRLVGLVRSPRDDEPREVNWRLIDADTDSFEDQDVHESDWPDDLTTLSWWRPTFWRSRQQKA